MLKINTGKRTFDFDPKKEELKLQGFANPHFQNNFIFRQRN